MMSRKEYGALLRQDLNSFITRTFQTVVPGAEFLPNWHIEAIAHHPCLMIARLQHVDEPFSMRQSFIDHCLISSRYLLSARATDRLRSGIQRDKRRYRIGPLVRRHYLGPPGRSIRAQCKPERRLALFEFYVDR